MLSQKAITRLNEVKEHILAEPNNLVMSVWSRSNYNITDTLSGLCGYSTDPVELNPPCGTAACIAGWICLLDPEWNRAVSPSGERAANILGWDYKYIPALFLVRNWPIRLQEKFATRNLRQRAATAAEAIDMFIAGGGQFK